MSGYGGALGGPPSFGRDDDPHHTTVEQQVAHVVACRTEAAAQFVAATLAAHGVQAQTHAYFHAIPSVDWVEGFTVAVTIADEAEARRVLRDLSSDDVSPLT